MKARKIFTLVVFISLLASMFLVPSALATPYRDYGPFITAFKALVGSHPRLASYESIGKTVLNQDILMFKIGNPAGGVALFDGAIHGWEAEGGELLYAYAQWLLTSTDPLAERILARTYTLIVPAVNIDGYNGRRTNMNGVNINRNFATNWQYGGSSNPTSEDYRGPAPLSEPETQALYGIFQRLKPRFYVNLHDGGGESIMPSSYANRTYVSLVLGKINSLCAQRGVAAYDTLASSSAPGFSITDAVQTGARASFLLELGNGSATIPEVGTVVLARFIPYAVVLSQESESNVFFKDNFESADFGNWDGNRTTTGENLSVSNRLSKEGMHSGYFSADGDASSETAYVYKNIESSATVFARGYLLVTSFTATATYSRFYFAAFAVSGQTVAMAGCRLDGNVTYWRLAVMNASDWVIVDSPVNRLLNRWYRFELQWAQNATDGYGKLYIDNQLACSTARLNTTRSGSDNSVQFGIAMSGNAKTTFYLDYIQVSRVTLGYLPIPEDLNQDFKVDMLDLSILARALHAAPGSSLWDPRADSTGDSKIDIADLVNVAVHFGETTSGSL